MSDSSPTLDASSSNPNSASPLPDAGMMPQQPGHVDPAVLEAEADDVEDDVTASDAGVEAAGRSGGDSGSPSLGASPSPQRNEDAPFAANVDDDETDGSGTLDAGTRSRGPSAMGEGSVAPVQLSVARRHEDAPVDVDHVPADDSYSSLPSTMTKAEARGSVRLSDPQPDAPDQELPSIDETATAANAAREEKKWRQRSKHVFIVSSAGKPIFTRYGDETEFSELFGILQVLTNMAQSTGTAGSKTDTLRRVAAGDGHSMYFHTVGELLYVMVTRTRESPKGCIRQLKLIHSQLQSVLPTVNQVLTKSPGYDVRRMFSHGDVGVMQSLIKRLSNDPSYYFRALHPVSIPLDVRRDLDDILMSAHAGEDHYFTFLLYRGKVVSLICPKGSPLHADDVLLLINFTHCIATTQGGEVWAPLCLPKFNDTGYMWCYTQNVSVAARLRGAAPNDSVASKGSAASGGGDSTNFSFGSKPTSTFSGADGMLLVQLATSQECFPQLSDSAQHIVSEMITKDYVLQIETMAEKTTLVPIDKANVGTEADVLMFLYHSEPNSQFVMSELPPQLKLSKTRRKEVFRLLVKLRDKLLQSSKASNPVLVHNTEQYNILVEKSGNSEFFLVCLPSTPKKAMMTAAKNAIQWVRSKESMLMMTKVSHWPS